MESTLSNSPEDPNIHKPDRVDILAQLDRQSTPSRPSSLYQTIEEASAIYTEVQLLYVQPKVQSPFSDRLKCCKDIMWMFFQRRSGKRKEKGQGCLEMENISESRKGKAKAKEKQPGHPFSIKGATCSTEATRTPTTMFSISVTIPLLPLIMSPSDRSRKAKGESHHFLIKEKA
ncbi:hypothetical protein ACFX2I_023041 [Malus domestica]